jgi:hypothetical protein
MGDTLHLLIPWVRGLVVCIMSFLENLIVEQKTLGWEYSIWVFENVFENLGIVPIPMKCFQE